MKIKFMDRFSPRTKLLAGASVLVGVATAVSYNIDLANINDAIVDASMAEEITDRVDEIAEAVVDIEGAL